MRKAVAACAVALASAISLSGCSSATYENGSGEVAERFDNGGWKFRTLNIITDRKTGVQYMIVEHTGQEIAVSPLFNADGTLCVEGD